MLSFRVLALWATYTAVTLAFLACGNPKGQEPISHKNAAIREAYLLLDKDEPAKATLILEDELAKDPTNKEVKLLLASAYIGQAGIDVFSVHDRFQDILFSKSLSDNFWTSNDTGGFDKTKVENFQDPANKTKITKMEQFIEGIDEFFNNLRRTLQLLNRFPKIPVIKWPMIERSFELLDTLDAGKDVSLYRLFVRVAYLRQVLTSQVIQNDKFGTREWACQIELDNFYENLLWSVQQLEKIGDDFVIVFPDKSSPFEKPRYWIAFATELLRQSRDLAPVGTLSGFQITQHKIKESFKCEIR